MARWHGTWINRSFILWLCSSLACTPLAPLTPHVLVTPAPSISYVAFLADETSCRRLALAQNMPPETPVHALIVPTVSAVLLFTLGLLLGLATGHVGPGVALGAGLGVWVGEKLGSERSMKARQERQRQYDLAYVQCMAAAGHRIPSTWWIMP